MTTRTNEAWVAELGAPGPAQEAALADLRAVILAGLPYALSGWLSPDEPTFAALAEEVAQETLVRVLDRLSTFEGRSRFTTWAQKIAVRFALTELRRRRWRDVSLDEQTEAEHAVEEPSWTADPGPGPETQAARDELLASVRRMLDEELTERQRRAMTALALQGMPLEEVARRLGTERNALYKLLHDARLRLKKRLAREGLTPAEALALFADP